MSTTTRQIQSDTPRSDAACEQAPGRGRPPRRFAQELERELAAACATRDEWCAEYVKARDDPAALRANLERLAARWAAFRVWQHNDCSYPGELRRVLAGEVPPEPGQPWPAAAVADGPREMTFEELCSAPLLDDEGDDNSRIVEPPAAAVDPATLDEHGGGPQSRRDESAGGPQ